VLRILSFFDSNFPQNWALPAPNVVFKKLCDTNKFSDRLKVGGQLPPPRHPPHQDTADDGSMLSPNHEHCHCHGKEALLML